MVDLSNLLCTLQATRVHTSCVSRVATTPSTVAQALPPWRVAPACASQCTSAPSCARGGVPGRAAQRRARFGRHQSLAGAGEPGGPLLASASLLTASLLALEKDDPTLRYPLPHAGGAGHRLPVDGAQVGGVRPSVQHAACRWLSVMQAVCPQAGQPPAAAALPACPPGLPACPACPACLPACPPAWLRKRSHSNNPSWQVPCAPHRLAMVCILSRAQQHTHVCHLLGAQALLPRQRSAGPPPRERPARVRQGTRRAGFLVHLTRVAGWAGQVGAQLHGA